MYESNYMFDQDEKMIDLTDYMRQRKPHPRSSWKNA